MPEVMWGESYKSVAYFYCKQHVPGAPASWAVGLSEICFGSEACSVFINTIISGLARLLFLLKYIFIYYLLSILATEKKISVLECFWKMKLFQDSKY